MGDNARSKLNAWASKFKNQVKLEWTQAKQPPDAKDKLQEWKLTIRHGSDTLGEWIGHGSNKKVAQEAAAQLAYPEVTAKLTPPLETKPSSLTDTILLVLKTAGREPAFWACYEQCLEATDGWVPLSLLVKYAKAVRNWYNRNALPRFDNKDAPGIDTPLQQSQRLATILQEEQQQRMEVQAQQVTVAKPEATVPAALPAETGTVSTSTTQTEGKPGEVTPAVKSGPIHDNSIEGMELELNGLSVSAIGPSAPTTATLGSILHEMDGAFLPSADTNTPTEIETPRHVVAVLVRADPSVPALQRTTLLATSNLIQQVSKVLQEGSGDAGTVRVPVTQSQLVCSRLIAWEAVGTKWPKYSTSTTTPSKQPPQPGDETNQQTAMETDTPAPSQPTPSGSWPPTTTATVIEAPNMWSLAPEPSHNPDGGLATKSAAVAGVPGTQQLNRLASWLAGMPVYGDVLLTSCRPRNKTENGQPVVRWADLTVSDVVLAIGALLPSAKLAMNRNAPLLQKLPTSYYTTTSWFGVSPKQLLADYCSKQLTWQLAVSSALGQQATTGVTMPIGKEESGSPTNKRGARGAAPVYQRTVWSEFGSAEASTVSNMQLDEEAGETKACIGFVSVQLPCNGIQLPGATSQVYLGEADALNNTTAGWESAENQAALRVLHQLHVADRATIRALLAGNEQSSHLAPKPLPASNGLENLADISNSGVLFTSDASVADPAALPQTHILVRGGTAVSKFMPGSLAHIFYRIGMSGLTSRESSPRQLLPMKRTAADALGPDNDQPMTEAHDKERTPQEAGNAASRVTQQPVVLECLPPEAKQVYVFQVESDAVSAHIEAAIRQLGIQGVVQCGLQVPLMGPDVLGVLPTTTATFTAQLVRITQPCLVPGGPGRTLFSPSLASQRHSLILQLCEDEHVRSIADLGCGSGALIDALLRDPVGCWNVQLYKGLDISRPALHTTYNRISRMLDASYQQAAPASTALHGIVPTAPDDADLRREPDYVLASTRQNAPEVQLYVSNGFDEKLYSQEAWGDFHGVDLAVMIEVVEHLWPETLDLVPGCVLGGMQPSTLIVTTPNWEYNAVMRESEVRLNAGTPGAVSGTWPGPKDRQGNPMRCTDHKFEWSRQEFQDWADQGAASFGYTVTFTGVGSVVNEQECVDALGTGGPGSLGWSTQVAIFRKRNEKPAV